MYKKIIFPVLISFLVVGCAEQQVRQRPQAQVMPVAPVVPRPTYVDIKLVVGKTTMKEVMEILGRPDSVQIISDNKQNMLQAEFWEYDFIEMKQANVKIIQKNGMEFSYTLGKERKNGRLSLTFEKGKLFGVQTF